MDKHAVAIVLEEIGTLLEIHGENKFKARAFINAARAVEKTDQDLARLTREHALESIAGIGPATAAVIAELVTTGTSRYYLQLRERTPDGLLELLSVPRLGAQRIRTLHEELEVTSVDDLEAAARAGRVAPLKGFGPRTEQRILEGIGYVRSIAGRRRYADAVELGSRLRGFVASLPGVLHAEVSGELRRRCETVDAIEVVAAVTAESRQAVLQNFLELPGVVGGEQRGQSAVARVSDGVALRLICSNPEEFGARLLFATGSAGHLEMLTLRANDRGFALEPAGLVTDNGERIGEEEKQIYRALGLQYVEPELREASGEIEGASQNQLPTLITYADLKGCFHCHTTYSDGKAGIAEMAEAAHARGWRYLGIADHSQYAGYAGGLTREAIQRQHDEIDEWNDREGKRVWLFKGIEADILPDGRLDYEDEPDLLASFDYVIASAHSAFGLPAEEQTRRFLRVIENPYLTFLGHLTGRLLLSRRGYHLDVAAVLQAAAARGVGVEINSDPHRMELDWRHWPAASTLGIRAAINPDAHSPRQLDFVHYGIAIARKGWLRGEDVVNSWPLKRVRQYFRQSRRA